LGTVVLLCSHTVGKVVETPLFALTLSELQAVMRNLRYTYEFRQEAWRELCRRTATD
jgi:hypothetical protein